MSGSETTRPRDPRPPDGELRRGTVFGRYVITGRLGRGGHGEVYAAHDQVLQREVALKILAPSGDARDLDTLAEHAGWRLALREAQAMARLSHPRVVGVHDVGIERERVYICMERVAGRDLAQLLEGDELELERILAIFADAAEGLQAAHAAGLIHRDFKPSNVIVDDEGRARVADFGVAALRAAPEHTDPGEAEARGALTGVVGTHGYMAPEQQRGEPADARADIYAFCVALFEALGGRKPFDVADAAALLEAKEAGPPPLPTQVPAALRDVLARGLAADPSARPGSMTEVLRVLRPGPASGGTRPFLYIGAAAAVLAIGVVTVYAVQDDPPPAEPGAAALTPCADAEASFAGIWDRGRRGEVETAIGKAHATGTQVWPEIAAALDAWHDEWTAAWATACRAHHVDGTTSAALFDLQMSCLRGGLRSFGATIDALAGADADTVRRAGDLARMLPELDDCADLESLQRQTPLPTEPQRRIAHETLMEALGDAEGLEAKGDLPGALAAAEALVADAKALDFKPAEAAVLRRVGLLRKDTGDDEGAEAALHEAIAAAQVARADALEAEIWIDLVHLVGGRLRRHDEALRYAGFAEAAIGRLAASEGRRARLLGSRGTALSGKGDPQAALRSWEEALALAIRAYGEKDPRILPRLEQYAWGLVMVEHYDDALAQFERGLAISRDALGEDHLRTAAFHRGVAGLLQQHRREEEAVPHYQRTLEIRERWLAPGDPQIADAHRDLAVMYHYQGDDEKALEHIEEALAIQRERYGAEHPRLVNLLNEGCRSLLALGRLEEAQRDCGAARRIESSQPTPDYGSLSAAEAGLAKLAGKRGDLEAAERHWRAAIAAGDKKWGEDAPVNSGDHIGLANVLIDQGRAEEAVRILEHTLTLRTSEGEPHNLVPDNQFALARALTKLGRDRARVMQLLRDAATGFRAAGATALAAEVDALLESSG